MDANRFIVVDVGNTSTVIGAFETGGAAGRVSKSLRIEGGITTAPSTCRKALGRIAAAGADGAILASVVPAHVAPWQALAGEALGIGLEVLDHTFDIPVKLDYPAPATTGADRIANVCGAVARVPEGTPVMVVDIGTAVTYDLVSADRRFFAGVIGPGPRMLAEALHEKTALLPMIELDGTFPAAATDTVSAMRIGIEVGFRGMLRETVASQLPRLGPGARLFATGGLAQRYIPSLCLGFEVDPELTLFGLGSILARNAAGGKTK